MENKFSETGKRILAVLLCEVNSERCDQGVATLLAVIDGYSFNCFTILYKADGV